ncbi:MAG: hypothetical protein ABI852_11125 [Gemmatimonadaceae bacterium]
MPTLTDASAEAHSSRPIFTAFYIFGRVVLLLMVASVAYAAWIVVKNWSSVGV